MTAPTWWQQIDYQYNNWGWLTHINDPDLNLSGNSAIDICSGPAAGLSEDCEVLDPAQNGFLPPPTRLVNRIHGTLQYDRERQEQSDAELVIQFDRYEASGQVTPIRRHYRSTHGADSSTTAQTILPDSLSWSLPDSMALDATLSQLALLQAFDLALQEQLLYSGISEPTQAAWKNFALEAFRQFIEDESLGILMAAGAPPPPAGEDLFHERLYYETPNATVNAAAQKNGNIAWLKWRVAGRDRQVYGFAYDKLDRLTNAQYAEMSATGAWRTDNLFGCSGISYDLRGNIKTLKNHGITPNGPCFDPGLIDNLTYTYDLSNTGNKLLSVTDASGDTRGFKPGPGPGYTYDANGNMTADSYKGISAILYNHLNLPYKSLSKFP